MKTWRVKISAEEDTFGTIVCLKLLCASWLGDGYQRLPSRRVRPCGYFTTLWSIPERSSMSRRLFWIITGVAIAVFSVFGAMLVLGARNKAMRDLSTMNNMTPAPEKTIKLPLRAVKMTLAPPNSIVVTFPEKIKPRLIDMTSLVQTEIDVNDPGAFCAAVSADGSALALGSYGPDATVEVWSPNPLQRRHKITLHDRKVELIAIDTHARNIYAACNGGIESGNIWQIELPSEKTKRVFGRDVRVDELAGGYGQMFCIALSSGDKELLIARQMGVVVWDVAAQKKQAVILTGEDCHCNDVAIAPQHGIVATAAMHVELWDSSNWQRKQSLAIEPRPADYRQITFSSDGVYLAVLGNQSVHEPGVVVVWKLDGDFPPVKFTCHEEGMVSIAFMPNTHMLITAGRDSKVCTWDVDKLVSPAK